MPTRGDREAEKLKVYSLLVEGLPQSVVITRTGFNKTNVCRMTSELLIDEAIEIKVNGKPIIYQKGKNGNILDRQVLQRQVSVNALGVTQISYGTRPKTTRVHHKKYRFSVIRVGDIDVIKDTINGQIVSRPFLTHHGKLYHNTRHHEGKVQYKDQFVTVEWHEGKERSVLVLHLRAINGPDRR